MPLPDDLIVNGHLPVSGANSTGFSGLSPPPKPFISLISSPTAIPSSPLSSQSPPSPSSLDSDQSSNSDSFTFRPSIPATPLDILRFPRLPPNESRSIHFALPDDFIIYGHLPVAGAPGLLYFHLLNRRTNEQRAHLTPFKLRSLGGCDQNFIKLNPAKGVCIPRDEGIVYHADLRLRMEYLAKGVTRVLDPLVFAPIVPEQGQLEVRAYQRTGPFPRALNNEAGLPRCRCPVAVLCGTAAEDLERFKRNDGAELFCVVEPTFKPIFLHSDEEEKQGARRFMWLQPRMEYQVRLLGPGAEDWKVVEVEIMWSEAANDTEVNHKRLKKWTMWPVVKEWAPFQVKDERKDADETTGRMTRRGQTMRRGQDTTSRHIPRKETSTWGSGRGSRALRMTLEAQKKSRWTSRKEQRTRKREKRSDSRRAGRG